MCSKGSNVYQPCEHVTLFLTGSNHRDYYFDIPPKYFSDDRGSMCTVQVIKGSMNTTTQNMSIAFHLMNGSANGFSVNDNITYATGAPLVPDAPCIAVGSEENANAGGTIHGTGEYLLAARPQKLHIRLVHVSNTSNGVIVFPSNAKFAGVIVLKFTYYDATESVVNMLEHQNYKLL